jgi:hypothetical protein
MAPTLLSRGVNLHAKHNTHLLELTQANKDKSFVLPALLRIKVSSHSHTTHNRDAGLHLAGVRG